MGLTHIDAKVTGRNGRSQEVQFLVDSGVTYSLLPAGTWKALELQPSRAVTVALADGTKLTRPVSECVFSLQGVQGTAPVLLGESDDEPLMGAVTLENLGLILNPYKRTLEPMQVRG